MKPFTKSVALLAILPAILMILPMMVQANAQQATGQTQILGTCGVSFPDGNVVNYGPLLPDSLSSTVSLNMTNSGSVNATLSVAAGNWTDGSNDVMLVNVTHFSNTTTGGYYSYTGLQSYDQTITNDFSSDVLHTFFQILADLINPSFTGSATQTMNFTVSC